MSQPTYGKTYAEEAAENYERYFVPAIGAPVAADLVDAAGLRAGERVLDVACGTGIVARLASKRVGPTGNVVGLDINPGMIAVARRMTPEGVSIEWHESPAESIPLEDGSFDAALCGMGMQFFSDRRSALREIHRVLMPGGRFVANVPGPAPRPLEIMEEEIERHIGREGAAFVQAVFSLHEADEIRGLATDAGFGDVEVRSGPAPLRLPQPGEFLWQYVKSTPLAAAVAQVDEESRQALERDYAARCREFVKGGEMLGEVNMTTLIARK